MIVGAIYNIETGRITVKANGPDEEFLDMQRMDNPELAVYVGDIDMKTHYLPGGVPTERPVMALEVKIDGVVTDYADGIQFAPGAILEISGIPEGTVVYHPADRETVNDGFIEWTTDEPFETNFMFVNHPYCEVVLHAKIG